MRKLALGLATVAIIGCGSPSPAPQSNDVNITVVKTPELLRILEGHNGKIVVMDLWAEY